LIVGISNYLLRWYCFLLLLYAISRQKSTICCDRAYKKIGDLEWERATIYLGKKAIMRSDIEMIDEQIENYRENISILIEKVRNEVQRINHQNSRKG